MYKYINIFIYVYVHEYVYIKYIIIYTIYTYFTYIHVPAGLKALGPIHLPAVGALACYACKRAPALPTCMGPTGPMQVKH